MTTIRDFLARGLIAGLIGGVLAFGVAWLVGEPSVESAISLEEATASAEVPPPASASAENASVAAAPHTHDGAVAAAHSHDGAGTEHSHGEEAEVSRSLQSTAGLLTGTALLGMALGGLAGVCVGAAVGRFGRMGVRATSLTTAAAGFVVLYAVPFLAYPPNPPAVGSGESIGRRTMLYFTLVGLSIALAAIALIARRRLEPRLGGWRAGVVAVAGYAVATAVAIALMPGYNEVPDTFPAQLLFEFRQGSILTQLALWTGTGVVLAELAHRLVGERSASESRRRAPVPA